MNLFIVWFTFSLVSESFETQKQFFIDGYHKEQLKPRPIKRTYLWYMEKNIKE